MEPTAATESAGAPPTAPGQWSGGSPPRPAWPTVIGVIEIVFGVGGVLTYLWTIASLFIPPDPSLGEEVIQALSRYRPANVGLSVIHVLLSAALTAAGIGLVRRRPGSIRLNQWWAIARLAILPVGTLVGVLVQQDVMAAAGSPTAAMPAQFLGIILLISIVVGVAWGAALPIFLLIWLRLRTVRAEIETWRREKIA